jgi:hypothetical protein
MQAQPLTPAQATLAIKRILKSGGDVRFTIHAEKDKRAPRDADHNVDDLDVYNCLKHGRVTQKADYDLKLDEWAYTVEFQYDTHKLLTITAIFSAENRLTVITRYRRKSAFDRSKPRAPKK